MRTLAILLWAVVMAVCIIALAHDVVKPLALMMTGGG